MKSLQKFAALVTSAALALTCAAPAFAAGSDEVTKDENVFLILNADGSVQQQIVSDWLHSEGGLRGVADRSALQNIQNLKSDVQPQRAGDDLQWATADQDVYYQGTSTQAPPVEVQIAYSLDGQAMTAQEMLGKSGHVAITIQLTNHEKEEKIIGGSSRTVYTPFIVVAAAGFSTDHFTNVKAENGTVQTDSAQQLACFVAMPGMHETFDGLLSGKFVQLDDYFLDSITLEADTDSFEMPSLILAASTSMEQLDQLDDLPDLAGDLDELSDATDDLLDGVAKLLDGAVDLDDGARQLLDGTGDLKDGAAQLKDGAAELKSGLDTLDGKSKELRSGAGALKDGMKLFMTSGKDLQAAIGQAQGGVSTVTAQYTGIKQQYEALKPTLQALAGQLPSLKQQLTNQVSGAVQQAAGTAAGVVYDEMAAAVGAAANLDADALAQQAAQSVADNGGTFDQATFAATLAAVQSAMGSNLSALPGRDDVVAAAQQQTAANPDLAAALAALGQQIDVLDPTALAGQVDTMLADTEALMGTTAALMGSVSNGTDSDKTTLAGALNLLADGMGQLPAGVTALADGINAYTDGVAEAAKGAAKLKDGVDELDDGATKLNAGAADLKDGTTQLNDGVRELDDGVHTYATDGIDKLTGADEVQNLGALADLARAVQDRANAYTSYTGAPQGVHATVKFVYKVNGPEAPDAQPQTQAPQAQQAAAQPAEEKSLWQRIKDLF